MLQNHYLICYDLNEALENQVFDQPQEFLEKLGIHYKSFSFDFILNQWVFRDCTNTPSKMPDHISLIEYYDHLSDRQ
jgi:hypothetical protein